MKTNIKKVAVVIIVAVFIAGNAFAGESGCGYPGQRGRHSDAKDAIARELNLSADQQSRLEQERATHRETMKTLMTALKDKKRELRDAIALPAATKEQVKPIMAEIKKLQSDMADKRVDGIFAVKGILSPEQFAKLQSMRDNKVKAGHKRAYGKER